MGDLLLQMAEDNGDVAAHKLVQLVGVEGGDDHARGEEGKE